MPQNTVILHSLFCTVRCVAHESGELCQPVFGVRARHESAVAEAGDEQGSPAVTRRWHHQRMKRHYLVATAAVGAGLLLRYLLNPVLGQQGPYLILTLPIVAAAIYGGFGPALLATALATSAGTYLFINRGAGLHNVMQPENLARTLLFILIGLAIGFMGGQLQRSRVLLADKVRQLKASNRAKDNAMAVLGHEIRNPLSAIQSAQTLLQRASGDETRIAKASEVIERQVAQMLRMADDLLDLSSGMHNSSPAREPIDLRFVLQQALEQSAPIFSRKNHRLQAELGETPVVVTGDTRNRAVKSR